ncbi:hypothetical protein BN137_270 [Cronobacter condimenti 1330]|uniref:Uncharacterized protein n=1 Tax=Cronobacter condimenti 1330 TaxID=1073999 RepID=K7ZY75_9ENTR|nr:hypothetical protein BN137_270 [Cronobacter condimenti 1330]
MVIELTAASDFSKFILVLSHKHRRLQGRRQGLFSEALSLLD